MLELRKIYTRAELEEYYKTSRRDQIQKKLKKCGYEFTEAGRGNGYCVTITGLPKAEEQLKEYCIERLGFGGQTRFDLLLPFIYHCIIDDSFLKLQQKEMQEYFKERIKKDISLQTIAKYLKQLERAGWIYALNRTEFVYYVYNPVERKNVYITKEKYNTIYSFYWNLRANGKYDEAQYILTCEYGNAPKKRSIKQRNGIFAQEYNQFLTLYERLTEKDGY